MTRTGISIEEESGEGVHVQDFRSLERRDLRCFLLRELMAQLLYEWESCAQSPMPLKVLYSVCLVLWVPCCEAPSRLLTGLTRLMKTCYSLGRGNDLLGATLTATAGRYVHGLVEMRVGCGRRLMHCELAAVQEIKLVGNSFIFIGSVD